MSASGEKVTTRWCSTTSRASVGASRESRIRSISTTVSGSGSAIGRKLSYSPWLIALRRSANSCSVSDCSSATMPFFAARRAIHEKESDRLASSSVRKNFSMELNAARNGTARLGSALLMPATVASCRFEVDSKRFGGLLAWAPSANPAITVQLIGPRGCDRSRAR